MPTPSLYLTPTEDQAIKPGLLTADHFTAIASISINASFGSFAT